jgi:hypothetical protein
VARPATRLWPDERQRLLLRAALSPGPPAVDAWRRLAASLDPERLDQGSARLLPLVWSNLRRHGEIVGGLAARYRAAGEANRRLLDQLAGLLPVLGGAGVPTVLLKGAALVLGAYPDPGLRPMSDLDVLVPVDRVRDAVRALGAQGWAPEAPLTAAALRLTHSLPFRRPGHAPLDLHWHVFEECCAPADDESLWAASRPAAVDGVPTRVPAPEDQLLHVAVHGEKWVHVPGIRWIADAVVLVRAGGVRWERLVAEAIRRRFVLRMRAQLEYLRSAFEAPIPPEALAQLATAPVSRIERLEARWSVRDRRRPWVLVYWCNHRRAAPGPLPRAVLTFPRYLQAVWRLGSLADVPGAAAARLWRAARTRAAGPSA